MWKKKFLDCRAKIEKLDMFVSFKDIKKKQSTALSEKAVFYQITDLYKNFYIIEQIKLSFK
jgi:hypothetical protein